MAYDRRAELRDISDQNADRARGERQETRAAVRYGVGHCLPGQHHMWRDGNGGGVCECRETVSREEL